MQNSEIVSLSDTACRLRLGRKLVRIKPLELAVYIGMSAADGEPLFGSVTAYGAELLLD